MTELSQQDLQKLLQLKELMAETKGQRINEFNTVATISDLLRILGIVNKSQEELENSLDKVKKLVTLIRKQLVPWLLTMSNVKSLTLDEGVKIALRQQVFASLPKEDYNARINCLEWLKENGGGDLVSTKLSLSDPSDELKKEIMAQGGEISEDVNTNSLKAWFADVLGVKQGSTARLLREEVPKQFNLYFDNDISITH